MKNSMIIASLVLAAAAGAAQAGGDNINVGDRIVFIDGPGSPGGEFGVRRHGNNMPELFRTFCLEQNEYMDFNSAGFRVSGISTVTVATGGTLTAQVAWLYTQYRANTLPSAAFSDGAYGGTNHASEANSLQRAIWSLMGQAVANFNSDTAAVALRNAANSAVSSNSWSGIGNVRVMNLTWATSRSGYQEGANAQDQLVMIPLPSGAALGLAGLSVLAIRRRAAR